MLDEYETTEVMEMTYLYYMGFPHEFDRSNQYKVKMIFKGDPKLIKGMVNDLWEGNAKVDARKFFNAAKEVKKSLWIGGVYDPNHYDKKKSPEQAVTRQIQENEAHDTRTTDKQEE